MTIGQKIRTHRKRLRLSQEKLGKMVGVTKAAVSQWELADQDRATMPGLSHLTELANIFGISLSELVGGQRDSTSIDAQLKQLDRDLAEVLHKRFQAQIIEFKKLPKS